MTVTNYASRFLQGTTSVYRNWTRRACGSFWSFSEPSAKSVAHHVLEVSALYYLSEPTANLARNPVIQIWPQIWLQ